LDSGKEMVKSSRKDRQFTRSRTGCFLLEMSGELSAEPQLGYWSRRTTGSRNTKTASPLGLYKKKVFNLQPRVLSDSFDCLCCLTSNNIVKSAGS
jgi:hypothetical protein